MVYKKAEPHNMNKLENAREKINEIDKKIAGLFEARMDAVKDVIAYKQENDLPVFDGNRERTLIERNRKMIQNPDYLSMYEDFLQFMMTQSKAYQKSLIAQDVIAYSGIKGAFAHMISEKIFEGNPKLAFNSFEEVIDAVVDHKVEFGVIPFENTNSGLVGEVLDLLYQKPVYIVKVADLKVDQCLLGLPEASLKDIEWVYSKDQALMQSREFLESLGVKSVPYPNTALAAQYVAREQDKTKAAIGARENAALYNLKVLASHIEETATNTTRFLVVAASSNTQKKDHLAMIFTTSDEVGALSKVINRIAEHGINMDTLQSRPIKDRPFEYFFYVQCTGNLEEENLSSLMKSMEDVVSNVKILGTYEILEKQ